MDYRGSMFSIKSCGMFFSIQDILYYIVKIYCMIPQYSRFYYVCRCFGERCYQWPLVHRCNDYYDMFILIYFVYIILKLYCTFLDRFYYTIYIVLEKKNPEWIVCKCGQ